MKKKNGGVGGGEGGSDSPILPFTEHSYQKHCYRENKKTNSNQLKFQSTKTIPINLFLGCEKTNQRELKLKKTKACKI